MIDEGARQDEQMEQPRVLLALALAEGVARGDHAVDELVIAGFNDLEEAASAHAYLAGFLLQVLAHSRSGSLPETAGYVRDLLMRNQHGIGTYRLVYVSITRCVIGWCPVTSGPPS